MGAAGTSRLAAILGGRCPRCRRGRVFRGTFVMHDRCPVCGLNFLREPGYFTGAMYASYVLAVPLLGVLTLFFWLALRWELEWAFGAACLLFLLFVPAIFRYSRVIWMHFDRLIDPDPTSESYALYPAFTTKLKVATLLTASS